MRRIITFARIHMPHVWFFAITTAAILIGAVFLHLLPRLGSAGRRVSAALCRAPGLDWVITYFTVAPMIVGAILLGWRGFLLGIAAQLVALHLWQFSHEFANRKHLKGPRIVKTLNARVGRFRNYAAVWLTAIVTPMFWIVRLAEAFVYPPIRVLVDFPKYNTGDWVNVSRQKFEGLVGHDLIWCLYCDWMTGVWSLGTEMLRNVESFWCPIRFSSEKKCENCRIDFTDVVSEWVPPDGNMADVVRLLDEKYPSEQKVRGWFGHPVRITVKGKELQNV
jgi:hypothetical protein